jgi:hypothetical protein
MKCTCVSDLEKKVLAHLNETKAFKKPVKKVEMGGVAFAVFGNSLESRTVSVMKIELEGQAKLEKRNMFHSFCPFCGAKQEVES